MMRSCFKWCRSLCGISLRIAGPAGGNAGRAGGQDAADRDTAVPLLHRLL